MIKVEFAVASILILPHFIFRIFIPVFFTSFGVLKIIFRVRSLVSVLLVRLLVELVVVFVVPFPITWIGRFLRESLLSVDPLILWSWHILCLRLSSVACCLLFGVENHISIVDLSDFNERNHRNWDLDPNCTSGGVKLRRLHLDGGLSLVGKHLGILLIIWTDADVYSVG